MAPKRRRPPLLLVVAAASVLAVGLLVMLWPVLAHPIVADDRYWYPDAAGLNDGSYTTVITRELSEVERESRLYGRVAALAYIMRALSMLLVLDLAVWSSTPLVAGQALLKLALLALVMVSVLGFLRVLRHRRADGTLARLSWRTTGIALLVTVTLTAAGAQAHSQFRNGWISYAVLTWGAALVMVGTVALVVWVTRLAARHGAGATVLGVLVAAGVALFLNTSYELFYVAAPLIAVAVLQQPLLDEVVDPDGRRARRARWWVGSTFLVGFVAVFLGIRLWIARMCAGRSCYAGADLDLGPQTLVVTLRNLLTAVPGGARSELKADLTAQGMADQLPGWVSPGSVLVAAASALALVVLVRALAPLEQDPRVRRTEARLLLLGALVPAAAALGTALIMALSSLSGQIVVSIGSPYRNTMVTWTMLALTGAMVVAALQVARPRRLAPPTAAALVVTLLAAHTVAANYPALRASRVDPGNQAVSAVHREIVLGDPAPEADARRCATLDQVEEETSGVTRRVLPEAAERSFRHYHGGVYCSVPRSSED